MTLAWAPAWRGATSLILPALAHQPVRSPRWADEQAERAAQAAALPAQTDMADAPAPGGAR